MWWLYLDESGDLGFDFVNKKPSRFFTICVLVTRDRNSFKRIEKAVRKTLTKKLNKSKKIKTHELKGTNTSLEVKRYFYRQIEFEQFEIYSITLNKRRVYDYLAREKERLYNFIARLALERIPLEKAKPRVQLVLDKSKNRHEIAEFNRYIKMQIQARLDPRVPLDFAHLYSHQDRVLQAVDMFSWGIFRKHERQDREWYRIFQGKIKADTPYLP